MKKLTILLFAVTALAAGCKKFTENINTNPNQPTVVTPNVLLSAALTTSASNLANDFQSTARWMGYWSRSGSYIQTIPTETYNIAPSYADGEWQSLYGALTKYKLLENSAAGDPFYNGVAKTFEALHFSTLVDAFGNVPYSQAFNLVKYPNPKYDDAATIYAALVQQCDSAVYYFQKAAAFYAIAPSTTISTDDQYDIVYGRGKGLAPATRMNLWIKFANTVKLKLLMTAREATGTAFSSTSIKAELAKVDATGVGYIGSDYAVDAALPYGAYATTNNESASVNPGYTSSSAAQQNPFFGDFYVPAGTPNNDLAFYRANKYFVNFGLTTGDDRFTDDYAVIQATSPYVIGDYDGDPASLPNSNTSQLGNAKVPNTNGTLQSSAQDEFIISDFESLFWQAEAAQLGYISSSTATQLAQIGTEQSYVYVDDSGTGVALTDAQNGDTFLTGNAANADTTVQHMTNVATGGMKAVITLKWAALNSINWEQAYTDYRRTGYPIPDGTNFGFSRANNVVTHSSPNVDGVTLPINFPYRYLYPQSEINTNSSNIPSGTSAYTKIFWDNREK